MFEKNQSTSIKDLLIDNIPGYPRDVLEKVVNFQGEDFLRAVKEHTEIEISGFGLLYVAKGKLKKRIARWEKFLKKHPDNPEKLQTGKDYLEYLNNKQCQLLQNT